MVNDYLLACVVDEIYAGLRRRLLFVSMVPITVTVTVTELIESVPHSDKPWDVLQKAPL